MWMSQSGSSASSEMRYHANSVNSMPDQTNTRATTSTPSRAISRTRASGLRDSCGQTSTSKCVLSRTPIIAPIITVQTRRKRAISSVQM
jgi:hypothetical protein